MNNQEIIKKLNSQTNLGVKRCEEVLIALKNIITDAIKKGQEINFCNLGKFKIKRTNKMKYYNPYKKCLCLASPKNKVVFCANKKLIDAINF